jgi:hypothetical protein
MNTQKINKAISLLEASPNLGRGYLAYRGLFTKHDIKELISNKHLAHVAASVDMAEFLPGLPDTSTKEQKIGYLKHPVILYTNSCLTQIVLAWRILLNFVLLW